MKKITKNGLILVLSISIFYIYEIIQDKKIEQSEIIEIEKNYNSNIINGVYYISKDEKGNEYIVNAEMGEIDISDSNIIFLTNVIATIKLSNSDEIKIKSNFGKYNINNYNTIFSKNVIITYLDNKITSEYADFSIIRNSMIISKNVIYNNPENTLKADTININIKTKDTKIYMYDKKNKVKINSKK